MKVDFLGSTGVIQQLLGSPSTTHEVRGEGPTEFGTLIGQLDPNYEEIGQKAAQEPKPSDELTKDVAPEKEAMARYNFSSPELLQPQLLPQEVPAVEEPPTVKTPTVLSVRRVSDSVGLGAKPLEERIEHVGQMVRGAGTSHGIDPTLGMAVVSVESAFDPDALSSDGHFSKGLFQLLDSTAKTIIDREGLGENYVPYEPQQNVDLGVRYLRYLHDLFSSTTTLTNGAQVHPSANSSSLEKLAVAAFNAGEGRVAASQAAANRAGEDPSLYEQVEKYLPESTQEYVRKVLSAKQQFTQ